MRNLDSIVVGVIIIAFLAVTVYAAGPTVALLLFGTSLAIATLLHFIDKRTR